MRPVKVVIVCGTSIATATVGAVKLKEEFSRRRIPVEIKQAKTVEVRSILSMYKPDLVVAMAHVDEDIGVPKVNGMPLLTNLGLDEFWETLFDLVSGITEGKEG